MRLRFYKMSANADSMRLPFPVKSVDAWVEDNKFGLI